MLRLLGYVLQVWDRSCLEQPRAQKVPLVIPLVVYTGRTQWTSSPQLQDLFDADALPEAVRQYLPSFEFLLVDLSGVDGQLLAAGG